MPLVELQALHAAEREHHVPYQLLIDRTRARLDRERDQARREALETQLVFLIGLMELLEKMDALISEIAERTP